MTPPEERCPNCDLPGDHRNQSGMLSEARCLAAALALLDKCGPLLELMADDGEWKHDEHGELQLINYEYADEARALLAQMPEAKP